MARQLAVRVTIASGWTPCSIGFMRLPPPAVTKLPPNRNQQRLKQYLLNQPPPPLSQSLGNLDRRLLRFKPVRSVRTQPACQPG